MKWSWSRVITRSRAEYLAGAEERLASRPADGCREWLEFFVKMRGYADVAQLVEQLIRNKFINKKIN